MSERLDELRAGACPASAIGAASAIEAASMDRADDETIAQRDVQRRDGLGRVA